MPHDPHPPGASAWTAPRHLGDVVVSAGQVPGGTRFRRHAHEVPHLCCVLDGGFVESEPYGPRDVGPGTVRLSPPGRHDIDFPPAGARCLIVELRDAAGLDAGPRSLFLEDPWLGSLAAATGHAVLRSGPGAQARVDHLVAELVAQVSRRRRARAARIPPRWLAEARERLRAAEGRFPAVAELAAALGVDRAHLARAFRDHYGVTMGAFARGVRVERALRLLGDAARPLSDIALEAGFADQSHMTRVVAAATGATPARLRASLAPHDRGRAGGEAGRAPDA
jgi:AraC family transcriptional regulator